MKLGVGISGGIDSFYALKWSLEHYEDVTAVFLNFLDKKEQLCKIDKITKHFKIPLKIIDCCNEFKEKIITYFVDDYLKGNTPNPCVLCNKYFKFSVILNHFDKVVTGHYAKIEKIGDRYFILKGEDKKKEQSYFIATINPELLENIILPLGNLTKKNVMETVLNEYSKFGENKESQEICFIENDDYKKFLLKYGNLPEKEGYIKSTDNKILGKHRGFYNFTIGQRKGLNIAMGKPYYVVKIEPVNNTVYAAPLEETFNKTFEIKNVIWYDDFEKYELLKVKVRYRTEEKLCKITGNKVFLLEREQSVTPGQLAVFYHKNLIIGSGWIENVDK